MPKLAWNSFISLHTAGYELRLGFPDYKSGGTLKWSGENLPSPNAIAMAAAKTLGCDYAVKSAGKVQLILIQDAAGAQSLAKSLGAINTQSAQGPHIISAAGVAIDVKHHIKMAAALGLILPPPTGTKL